jgi:general secretion pathway protein A
VGAGLVDGEPCPTAARLNLRCLQTKGGIDDLRLLDRPAMLTLRDDPTAPNYVLLTALDERGATIVAAGGKPQTVASMRWRRASMASSPRSGARRAVWRDEVSAGDHGPDVDWLAKRLAQIYELKKPQENQPLDAGLRKHLVDFQSEQHLKADGVAGPKTFIRLYQLGGVQEPRLLASAATGQGNNMSYILEALKKAQAERQLGTSPTLHAPTLA